MTRTKKEKLEQSDNELILNKDNFIDYGNNFPIFLEIPKNNLNQLGLYNYIISGRLYRLGLEIICVELLNKHK